MCSSGKLILQQHKRGGDPLRVGKESTVGVSQWMKLGLPLILIPYAAIFHAKGNSLWLNVQSTHFIRFMGKQRDVATTILLLCVFHFVFFVTSLVA